MIRKFHFKQDRYLIFFFVCLAFTLVVLCGCLFVLKHLSNLQIASAEERYKSYRIANELRRTSDDLTTMVRLYVVTKEKKYRDHFNEILAIRAGKSPRPEKYDEIYWDLILNSERPRPFGDAKSLKQIMIEHRFSLKEFDLLKEAENNSDELAVLEEEAMNAVEGLFQDNAGHYTVKGPPNTKMAQDLVFGDSYMKTKAEIMTPIQQFLSSVDERTGKRSEELERLVTLTITIAIALAVLATIFMIFCIVKAIWRISIASEENEMLLLNILPASIAARLKKGEEVIADEYPQASVLFCDIVGFTGMTSKIGVVKMVDILSHLFDEFDVLAAKNGVEKIKTIGDNYMAVAGVPDPAADHAIRLANFALDIREKVNEFAQKYNIQLQMRIGMTYGAVIAGVIGHKKFIYDVWGDVVNTASRMESTGIPNEIQITEKMALLLEEQFVIEPGGEHEVKGKGMMKTFFLKGRKSV